MNKLEREGESERMAGIQSKRAICATRSVKIQLQLIPVVETQSGEHMMQIAMLFIIFYFVIIIIVGTAVYFIWNEQMA